MKTLILLLVLLFSCSLAYAGYVEIGGFYPPVTKTYSGTDQASGTIVWAPASGKKIVLMGMLGSFAGPVRNTTTGSLGTGIDATTGFGTFVEVIPFVNIASGPIVITSGVPIWQGATNGTLSATTSGRVTAGVVLWGYEKD